MAPTPDNIWSQMGYVPPRGSCQHKDSLLSPKCACLRFMIHPSKVGSSFNCDGCNHHASFHNMENPAEKQIVDRWRTESIQLQQGSSTGQRQVIEVSGESIGGVASANNKRKRPRRAIESTPASEHQRSTASTSTRSQTGFIDLEEVLD